MAIQKVMVIGGGVMGRGISQLIAATGIGVLLLDLNQKIVKQSIKLLGYADRSHTRGFKNKARVVQED